MIKNKNSKNIGLGSGLSSLLGNEFEKNSVFSDNNSNDRFRMVPIEFIEPGPWQPRKIFDKDEIDSLADSIKKQGVIQPIILKSKENKKNEFFIIAGERRWRASQQAEIHEIPSIIRDDVKDEKIAELSLVENIQRSELNPIEEAEGYQSLINKYNYKQEDVAKAVGKSRSHIANITRLLSLSDLAKDLLLKNKLTIGQIRPLIGHSDCDYLLDTIVKNNLTSRQVEKLVKKITPTVLKSKRFKEIDTLDLEKELLEITGLNVNIDFDQVKKVGSIKLECKNLSEFNFIIKKLKS
ncbi:ParB/RepB/Spo0J family partition protein [Alphaproteobacteria bacterium]|nr:ParB/RepB/Spo0J family partition protein [Alphaproteobacteria bacterium]